MKHITQLSIMILFVLAGFVANAQGLEFDNPIAENRADPWVTRDADGTYYLIATVPEYNRIVIRKSKTINGLKGAEEK